ncbi:MAG: ABC transporter substrate-binding protein [Coriobacteriia bacterium]|nr:ABC transporter substrate-binding protein [Coriobacteriia bacterium]MBS5478377.1 ABC transporter substrate-binding protein [Coriobacteriia bacterium]
MASLLFANISRRSFAALAAAGVAGLGLGAHAFAAESAKKDAKAVASSAADKGASTSAAKDGATKTVTDCAGRTVEVPAQVNRVAELHPQAGQIVVRLAGADKLVCVDTVFSKAYLADSGTSSQNFDAQTLETLKALPVTNVFMKGADKEALVSYAPDVIFTLDGDGNADELQNTINIPVVCLAKSPVDKVLEAFKVAGEVLNNEADAQAMCDWWEAASQRIADDVADLAADERPTVMYCGKNGEPLQVPGKDTIFARNIVNAGCTNVTDELQDTGNESIDVSLEQVIGWDPDYIVCATQNVADAIMSNPDWASLKAVQNGTVIAPLRYAGFDGWFSVLGTDWLNAFVTRGGDAAYVDQLHQDMQDFFQIFYGTQLTDEQLEAVATA